MTGRRRTPAQALGLQGAVWLTAGSASLGGRGRIGLLRCIAQHGSITQAAKAMGMGYKAAWDAVDKMNTLAGEPLVARTTGGRGGGSTTLTARGEQLVARFGDLDAAHQRFVQLLSADAVDLRTDYSVLRTLNMKTSARNQLLGTVSAVRAGAVNDEVELTLPGGARIVAIVTRESTQHLGLRTGMTAFALIPAPAILLGTDLGAARLSARNQLAGTVRQVTPGAVNAEVTLELAGGEVLVITVTQASVKALELVPGLAATALFKASSVILGVSA